MSAGSVRIGLSSCYDHADPERRLFTGKTLLYVERSMLRWVQATGAIVYPVPDWEEGVGPSAEEMVGDLDGLVLHGGADVCPRTYGEEPLRPEWEGDPVRDNYEVELVQLFRTAGKPVLGICRGLQVLNVALGGTLYQDLTSQLGTQTNHRDPAAYDRNRHAIDVLEGSLLARTTGGSGRGLVNSVHHQGVKDPGDGLVVEAVSADDGVVEAMRVDDGGPWAYGVQWHPEFYSALDADLLDTTGLRTEFISKAMAVRGVSAYPPGV